MRQSLMERAFELARSGRFADTIEIEKHLRAEGIASRGDLDGPALRRQIRDECHRARGKPVREPMQRPSETRRRQTRPRLFV